MIWGWIESLIHRLPVVNKVYGAVKQVTDFAFSEKRTGDNADCGSRVSAAGHVDDRIRDWRRVLWRSVMPPRHRRQCADAHIADAG